MLLDQIDLVDRRWNGPFALKFTMKNKNENNENKNKLNTLQVECSCEFE